MANPIKRSLPIDVLFVIVPHALLLDIAGPAEAPPSERRSELDVVTRVQASPGIWPGPPSIRARVCQRGSQRRCTLGPDT